MFMVISILDIQFLILDTGLKESRASAQINVAKVRHTE